MQVAAIDGRRQAAPGRGVVDTLVGDAEGQGAVVAEVGFANGVEHRTLAVGDILKAVARLVRRDHPPAQGGVVVEWPGSIHFAAVVVPATGAGGDAHARVRGRALAHHVDGRRWRTRPLHQPGGAAHHFDVVVDGHVRRRVHVPRQVMRQVVGQPVVHQVFHGKATRVERRALRAILGHRHARGALEHIFKAAQVLVVHALTGDHRH
ncbi:hypothetical protein D3C76_1182650 [compost metagenome]